MRVLIACEESQVVCKAFRAVGHEAYSCDLQPCSGGHPEWHYEQGVFEVIDKGWDLMIAHPPCTYLTVTANKWIKDQPKRESGALVGEERRKAREEALEFFIAMADAPITRIAIENPIGYANSMWREPDQIIQPYYFGDEFQKTTCLWLKNLPMLMHFSADDLFNKSTHVGRGEMTTYKSGKVMPAWYANASMDAKTRSKTFPGIAQAMATQWGMEQQ